MIFFSEGIRFWHISLIFKVTEDTQIRIFKIWPHFWDESPALARGDLHAYLILGRPLYLSYFESSEASGEIYFWKKEEMRGVNFFNCICMPISYFWLAQQFSILCILPCYREEDGWVGSWNITLKIDRSWLSIFC